MTVSAFSHVPRTFSFLTCTDLRRPWTPRGLLCNRANRPLAVLFLLGPGQSARGAVIAQAIRHEAGQPTDSRDVEEDGFDDEGAQRLS